LKPHALPVARKHIVLGSIGAGTGLAVTSMFSHWLLGEVNLWFIAPMGASAVLLFGVPSSPLAQPWSIVGGNVLSALIGVTVGCGARACAGLRSGGGLAIAAMYFLRCLHPPGGAVALTAILGGAGCTARAITLC
jgi:CBS domain-containing membrane protein